MRRVLAGVVVGVAVLFAGIVSALIYVAGMLNQWPGRPPFGRWMLETTTSVWECGMDKEAP